MYELHFMLLLINNLERKKVGKKNNKKQKILCWEESYKLNLS